MRASKEPMNIEQLKRHMDRRLGSVKADVRRLERKMDGRFTRNGGRLASIEGRLASADRRFDSIDDKLNALLKRVDMNYRHQRTTLSEHENRLRDLERRPPTPPTDVH